LAFRRHLQAEVSPQYPEELQHEPKALPSQVAPTGDSAPQVPSLLTGTAVEVGAAVEEEVLEDIVEVFDVTDDKEVDVGIFVEVAVLELELEVVVVVSLASANTAWKILMYPVPPQVWFVPPAQVMLHFLLISSVISLRTKSPHKHWLPPDMPAKI